MKRTHFSLFFIFLFVSSSFSQVTFIGGGDGTSWEDPLNWDSGAVPLVTDDVVIDGTSAVTVTMNDAVCANLLMTTDASLMISTSAILNIGPGDDGLDMEDDAKITVNGSLNVMDSGSNCIDMDDRSEIVNNGNIMIDTPDSEGINMDNDAVFTNNLGSVLDINMVDGNDGICMDDNDTVFDNFGRINIKDVTDTGEGIEVDDGIFTNHPSGQITMTGITGDALKIESGGDIVNQGSLMIQANPGDTDQESIEIDSDATLTNEGYISINITNGVDTEAILLEVDSGSGPAVLNNEMCGVIEIRSNNRIEVQMGSTINNDGVISTVYDMTHSNDGTINNNAGAYILSPNGFMVSPNAVVNNGNIDPLCAAPTPRVASLCEGGPCAAPIPTLSQWMVIILGILFLIIGVVYIRETRRVLA